MTAKVYGIPNCDSVKKAIASLKNNDVEIVFHDFKKHGVPAQLLDEWIGTFGLEKVINRRGQIYSETLKINSFHKFTISSSFVFMFGYSFNISYSFNCK